MAQNVSSIKFMLRFPHDNVAVFVFLYKQHKFDCPFLFQFPIGKSDNGLQAVCLHRIGGAAQVSHGCAG